ncbi:cytochrome P450 2U1-like [Dreissena polymorpha]|nr:cytochrome P450 2U1-like [Dreissena polymorpha]
MINLPKWLQKIICKDIFLHHEKKKCAYDVIHKYTNDRIKERHENFNSNLIRDYADVHLNLKSETPSRDNYQVNSSFELMTTIFATGVVSISNALMWTILYMQEYPDVQNKCRDVLNEICGHSNVYWSDRKNVPYIEAVIMEINRLSSNVPFTVSHTSEKETTLLGFTIPKKSVIRANLYSAHMDPRYWEEPHVFNPDRFLKDEKLIRNPAYMPFGIGPRKCVAHRMSELIQFVTFSNLVRRVSFEREDPNETHTFQLVYEQVTSRPIPFKTISTVL